MKHLDRLFLWLRAQPFFYRLTLFTRIMLAAGFIPTGSVKLMGHRFTALSTDTTVGAFFEALYQTGGYWQFIGLCQVVAGILLLIPRLAHLGAALFLPIIANIVVITIALHFTGTPFVTVPMLLAVLYLCFWDFDRFRGLLAPGSLDATIPRQRLDPVERVGFVVFALCLVGFFTASRSFLPAGAGTAFVLVGLVAGLLTAGRFFFGKGFGSPVPPAG